LHPFACLLTRDDRPEFATAARIGQAETRRAVLGRLGTGPASVGELAAPFSMALPYA